MLELSGDDLYKRNQDFYGRGELVLCGQGYMGLDDELTGGQDV